MTKLKCWKKHIVKPNRILYTSGKFKQGEGYKDWVHIDKLDGEYEVGAKEKINKETISGYFKFFKSKPPALKFANKYMKKHNKC